MTRPNMKRISNFTRFSESISGTEMIGPVGPVYGRPILRPGLDAGDVTMLQCDVDGKMYTKEDYDNLHRLYVAAGNEPLDGFSKANLDMMAAELAGR